MTEDSPKVMASMRPYSLWSRRCVYALYVLSAIWGVLQIAVPDNASLYSLFALLFAVTATLWARYDSLACSKPILPILQMLYFLVWPIGAMVYLIFRSGWHGLGMGILHGVGLFATLALSSYSTLFGLHFAGLLDQRFYQSP